MFDLGNDDNNRYSKPITHFYVWSMDYSIQQKVYFNLISGQVNANHSKEKVPANEVDTLLKMIVNISPGKNLTVEPV